MTTYADSGVDIEEGDKASHAAYTHAVATFPSRKGLIGEPIFEEGGFAGFLDMGDYYLVQSDDSTGSKIDIAFKAGKLDTLGFDLVAMVADDAVCTGAEPISISNTLDVPKIDAKQVDTLMSGLSKACQDQKIVVPAGEIAEVPGAVERGVWSATVVGIVEKDKILQPQTIEEGDVIISLRSAVARCNGFSLIRKILTDKFGESWTQEEWKDGKSWGEIVITPSIIYSDALLKLLGRYKEERQVNIKGLAHITGGGIPSKLKRVLKKCGCGAKLSDLWSPHDSIKNLIELGNVPIEEAYKTWNMGNGMLVVVDEGDADKTIGALESEGMEAQRCGVITKERSIEISAYTGAELAFVPK